MLQRRPQMRVRSTPQVPERVPRYRTLLVARNPPKNVLVPDSPPRKVLGSARCRTVETYLDCHAVTIADCASVDQLMSATRDLLSASTMRGGTDEGSQA